MNKIQITEEYFEKYQEDFKFDDDEFDTEQEIEVRVPFEGYYSLKVKCKNPQIAMTEVLKANRDIGIMCLVGGDMQSGDANEKETYAIVINK